MLGKTPALSFDKMVDKVISGEVSEQGFWRSRRSSINPVVPPHPKGLGFSLNSHFFRSTLPFSAQDPLLAPLLFSLPAPLQSAVANHFVQVGK